MRRRMRTVVAATMAALASLAVGGSSLAASNAPSTAPTPWSFASKQSLPVSAPAGQVVANVRGTGNGFTTPQGHYDRVVFDTVSASHSHKVGYIVRYVSRVQSEGQGATLSLHGAFKLLVVILAPAYNEAGQNTYYAAVNHNLPGVSDGVRVVDTVFGGSFEGQTTFGIGLNGKQRFRVVQLNDGRVAVDILR